MQWLPCSQPIGPSSRGQATGSLEQVPEAMLKGGLKAPPDLHPLPERPLPSQRGPSLSGDRAHRGHPSTLGTGSVQLWV